MYGVDWAGPLPLSDEECVTVPPVSSPLSDLQYQELLDTIYPLDRMSVMNFAMSCK